MSSDGTSLVVATKNASLDLRALVDDLQPLLVPFLRDCKAFCTVTQHKTPTEAVTVALGGTPWCMGCGQ